MGYFNTSNTSKGDGITMAIFISKNFQRMELEGENINRVAIKCGLPEVTKRSFEEIVGREREELYEDNVLRLVLREIDELDFPFDFLLCSEFGHGLTQISNLSEFEKDYLLSGSDIVMMDFHHIIRVLRECFNEEVRVYQAMAKFVRAPHNASQLLTLQ